MNALDCPEQAKRDTQAHYAKLANVIEQNIENLEALRSRSFRLSAVNAEICEARAHLFRALSELGKLGEP